MFYKVLLLVVLLPTLVFSYTVVRNDGKIFSGELVEQSPQGIVLKDNQGITIRFKADQIDWDKTTEQIREEETERPAFRQYVDTKFETKVLTKPQTWTGEPYSFDFKDIDIKDLFRFIAEISGLNVILDPSVKGSVTLRLTEVPWDQALDIVTRNQGLGYTVEGNVIWVAPFSKFAQQAKAQAAASTQQMLSGPLVTKIKRLSYAKAADVDKIVRKMLTPRGSTIVDPRTNTLIVTDVEYNLDQIEGTVGSFD